MIKSIRFPAYLHLCLLLGCTQAPNPRPPVVAEQLAPAPTTQPAPQAPVSLDDQRLQQHLAAQATRLIESGRTVKLTSLISQLNSPRCRVDLPLPLTENLAAEDLYARMKPSVLVVAGIYKCPKCQNWHAAPASGFVISASGVAITNYHVVNSPDRETLVAMTADGRVVPVKAVLAANKADDVAIIQLDATGLIPLALSPAAPVGSRVHVISHPDGRFYMLTAGLVSRYHNAMNGNQSTPRMDITADYAKGSSGAPVLDAHGSAVGLVASTTSIYYNEKDGQPQNLQMVIRECIPASCVLKLIER